MMPANLDRVSREGNTTRKPHVGVNEHRSHSNLSFSFGTKDVPSTAEVSSNGDIPLLLTSAVVYRPMRHDAYRNYHTHWTTRHPQFAETTTPGNVEVGASMAVLSFPWSDSSLERKDALNVQQMCRLLPLVASSCKKETMTISEAWDEPLPRYEPIRKSQDTVFISRNGSCSSCSLGHLPSNTLEPSGLSPLPDQGQAGYARTILRNYRSTFPQLGAQSSTIQSRRF